MIGNSLAFLWKCEVSSSIFKILLFVAINNDPDIGLCLKGNLLL